MFCSEELNYLPYKNQNKSLTLTFFSGKIEIQCMLRNYMQEFLPPKQLYNNRSFANFWISFFWFWACNWMPKNKFKYLSDSKRCCSTAGENFSHKSLVEQFFILLKQRQRHIKKEHILQWGQILFLIYIIFWIIFWSLSCIELQQKKIRTVDTVAMH